VTARSRRPSAALRASLRRSDFRRVSSSGQRFSTRYFLVYRHARDDGLAARLGITVTRKVGNAVRRNRIKRLVREWFRGRREELTSCDWVVIAKRDLPPRLDLRAVAEDLDSCLASEAPPPAP
jgi:ribonuclease P protein component